MKIHFDTAPKTSLHWFKNPLKIIKACKPAEVSIALEELQKYLDDGYWIMVNEDVAIVEAYAFPTSYDVDGEVVTE